VSESNSYSESFSATDVVKVANRFGADLVMLAQSSEAMGATRVAEAIDDIKLFAKRQYIERISVILDDADGKQLRARRYEVSTDASLWSPDRPGNNLWPKTPAGEISLVIHYSGAWDSLGDVAKANFKKELKRPWGPTDRDTSFSNMRSTGSRRYSSNSYGLERTDFA
jgi:hypothetical protein